jgi:hypothetical protein
MNVILEYDFYEFKFIVEFFNFAWPYINDMLKVLFDTNSLMLCYIGVVGWFISFIDTE